MSTVPQIAGRARSEPTSRVLTMSVEEFDAWVDEESRAEFMDGKVYLMSPESIKHSDLQGWLTTILSIFVRQRNLGAVYGPEVQMRLGDRRFEPDVLFVSAADSTRVKETYIEGPVEMAVEIVSPESAGRDWHDKFAAYAEGGIGEYWVIDPASQRCECYRLSDGGYQLMAAEGGKILSTAIIGFYLRSEWLWSGALPDPLAILEELGVLRRA